MYDTIEVLRNKLSALVRDTTTLDHVDIENGNRVFFHFNNGRPTLTLSLNKVRDYTYGELMNMLRIHNRGGVVTE